MAVATQEWKGESGSGGAAQEKGRGTGRMKARRAVGRTRAEPRPWPAEPAWLGSGLGLGLGLGLGSGLDGGARLTRGRVRVESRVSWRRRPAD